MWYKYFSKTAIMCLEHLYKNRNKQIGVCDINSRLYGAADYLCVSAFFL